MSGYLVDDEDDDRFRLRCDTTGRDRRSALISSPPTTAIRSLVSLSSPTHSGLPKRQSQQPLVRGPGGVSRSPLRASPTWAIPARR